MRKAAMLLLGAVLITGCATSKKEIAKYATATDLAEGIKPNFMEAEKGYLKRVYKDRHISTIVYRGRSSTTDGSGLEWAVDDLLKAFTEYCNVNGGTFKNFRTENEKKVKSLMADPANTYQVESRYFECGPEGRGTTSDDWTKFNPSICRKLYDTKVDYNSVNSKYGRPASYACTKDNSVLFMGDITIDRSAVLAVLPHARQLEQEVRAKANITIDRSAVPRRITVIEGNKGLLPISELENMDVGE